MNSYIAAMKKYATFTGRATRTEYWLFILMYFTIGVAAIVVDFALLGGGQTRVNILSSVVSLVHFIPSIAVAVRRLHDTNRSGWWYFIILIPLIGAITMIVFLCTKSMPGPNRFGPPNDDNASGVSPSEAAVY
ncbi:DUF805 domain-containing protein [Neorhizobium sp. P12A]|uniref:DUF805 domain-containing protein n=1 Tax=Neorhizobium sp. P12A TaxID=2268027 RepID=UPI0011EF56D9|nr:DUF805 domain-containing protein [Neorhizobium sp. P12A]KAA0699860.1 DUF805 domain-containing protein [Neorhizobium sp. P12A]